VSLRDSLLLFHLHAIPSPWLRATAVPARWVRLAPPPLASPVVSQVVKFPSPLLAKAVVSPGINAVLAKMPHGLSLAKPLYKRLYVPHSKHNVMTEMTAAKTRLALGQASVGEMPAMVGTWPMMRGLVSSTALARV